VPETLGDFQAQNNSLTEIAVNGLLIAFDNAGRTSGTCKLYLDGTGNAPATGEGLTAKASLQAKGWDVKTN